MRKIYQNVQYMTKVLCSDKYSHLLQDFISGNVILSIIMLARVLAHGQYFHHCGFTYIRYVGCGILSRYNVFSRRIFRYKCFSAVALDIINCTVNMSTRDGKTAC